MCQISLNSLLPVGIDPNGTWSLAHCGTPDVDCLSELIVQPDIVNITGVSPNQMVDFTGLAPGIYCFSYELGDFCGACGDCAEYCIWVGPGPEEDCALAEERCQRENCDPNEMINLFDWLDCGQTDATQPACANCGTCLTFPGAPEIDDCWFRHAFIDGSWGAPVVNGNNVEGTVQITIGTPPNQRTFTYKINITVPAGISWVPGTGIIDPCQSDVGVHQITINVALEDDPDNPACGSCEVEFTVQLTITESEDAGAQVSIPSVCN